MIMAILPIMVGCKWQDDFRGRVQPQYGDLPAEPTLNRDSEQYIGDKRASELEGMIDETEEVSIPEIDERSNIPALPEHPIGI